MEKMTKAMKFEAIRKILVAQGEVDLAETMTHELELLAKKNAKRSDKPTKAQAENAILAEAVIANMPASEALTVSEIQARVPEMKELSNQRATAVIRSLVRIGRLARTESKGKAFFSLV